MPYRVDRETEARERGRLEASIEARERAWTETFWTRVAPRRAVAPRRPVAELSFEELTRRAEALERLESSASEIERAWTTALTLPASPNAVRVDEENPPNLARFKAWLPTIYAADTFTLTIIDEAYEVAEDVPVVIDFTERCPGPRQGPPPLVFEAPVAPGLGPVRARPETIADSLLVMARLRSEPQIGDADFDGVAFVAGEPEDLERVFDAEVRSLYLQLARLSEPPRIDVAEGRVRVRVEMPVHIEDGLAPASRLATRLVVAIAKKAPPPLRA